MVLIAFPISEELNYLNTKYRNYAENTGEPLIELARLGEVLLSTIIFDLFLILGPLIITIIILRKGFNQENKEGLSYNADKFTYLGLLVLALMDTSGGLALFILYGVVIFNAIKYRHFFVLSVAPIILVAAEDNMMGSTDLIGSVLNDLNFSDYDFAEIIILGMPRLSCIIITITASIILIKSMIDGRRELMGDEVREMPVVAATIWLAVGVWGMLPEASWALFTITIAMTFQNIFTGRLFFIPYAPAAMLFSLLTALTLDSNFSDLTEGELISYSLFWMGIFSLILHYLARTGLLYRWAEEGKEDENLKTGYELFDISIPNLDSIAGLKQLITKLQEWTSVGLLLRWDALVWNWNYFWCNMDYLGGSKEWTKGFALLMPLLHAFALWNFIEKIDDTRWETIQNIVVGLILIGEGSIMTYISSKSEIAWNWDTFEFENEASYFDWLDRLGMISIFYIITGIVWIMETADLDSLMYGMIATYLCTVAIQGFQEETDSAWRRGFGGFGSLIAIFMLSTTINDPLYEAVTWLGLGIVAFGFGMMYMQRFGEDGDVYVGEQMVEAPATLIPPPITEEESIPEPVTEEVVEEVVEDVTEEVVEEVVKKLPRKL